MESRQAKPLGTSGSISLLALPSSRHPFLSSHLLRSRSEGCFPCCSPPQAQIGCPAAAVTATPGCSQRGWEPGSVISPHPWQEEPCWGRWDAGGKPRLNGCSRSPQAACQSGQLGCTEAPRQEILRGPIDGLVENRRVDVAGRLLLSTPFVCKGHK